MTYYNCQLKNQSSHPSRYSSLIRYLLASILLLILILAESYSTFFPARKATPPSKIVSVTFSDVAKITIAPENLMFGGEDILDYDAETKTITVLDKLGVFTLNLAATVLAGVDFDTLDWSYAKVVEGELVNCDDTIVTFTKDSVEPLKKVAFTITTIANVACSVVIDATISKSGTIIETSHSIKIEFKETPPEP